MTNESATAANRRPSLIDSDALRANVQGKYREVAADPHAEYHFYTGQRALEHIGYDSPLLDGLPSSVMDAYAGVANPFHWGLPEPGATVLDVGSGAGLDSVVAARAVGSTGAVIGVDMTPEMLERARAGSASVGLENVEFRLGFAEELPVESGSIDLVISNGVLNLVPDKHRAYEEVMRVLKPGGRFQIADIVVEREVPDEAKQDIDLWTG